MARLDFSSFLRYIEFEKRYSKHTVIAYETDLIQFSDYLIQVYQIDQPQNIKSSFVRSWLVQLVQQGVEPRSINRKISTLKSYFKFLLKKSEISVSPMLKVISPKISKRLPVYLETINVNQFSRNDINADDFSSTRDNLIFIFFYATGMRRSELIELTDSSIDLKRKQIKVLGKGNKERFVPLEQKLVEVIVQYQNLRNRILPKSEHNYFFVTNSGKKLYAELVYKTIKRMIASISTIEKKSPHVLRHTFATHLLNSGAEINAIKEILGHSSLAATQVYTHNSIEKLKEVYKQSHPKA